MPSIIPEGEPVSWSIYPLEQIVAEKLHALVVREAGNSRAKDIFDLVLLFRIKTLEKNSLLSLIKSTFQARRTELPKPIYRNIENMDLSLLRSAWSSIEIMGVTADFDEYWKELLENLRKL